MKKLLFLFLGNLFFNAQTVVVNEKLMFQLSKNQTVRLASNEGFLKSYEKQKELYDKANQKIAQVIVIQEHIYNKLHNVNKTVLQGKQLKYLYKYLGEVGEHSGKMLKLTAKYPQYAILLISHYERIINEALMIKKELQEEILSKDKGLLMDTYDREYLISRLFDRVRILHGNVLYINTILERGKDKPYIYQIPHLGSYVNMDKSIVEDILRKYQYLKY